WLLGKDILVHPVVEAGAQSVRVYFPGGENELWFDIEHEKTYRGIGYTAVPVTIDYTPVFYRGGSIIIRKDIPRPSSTLTNQDPYSVYVFLDGNNEAVGNFYCDDKHSFNYRSKKYIYYQFTYSNNYLSGRKIDQDADFDCLSRIGTVHVYNLSSGIAMNNVN
ncbi:glycoside hydrolase, partial [Oryctes borbonicus]